VDYWRLGVILGVIFFPGFLPIGVRWMLALRVMASNQSRMGHDFLADYRRVGSILGLTYLVLFIVNSVP
jgi:hypothetical protein